MRALAFSVHVLTACGAALALLALLAASHGNWPLMFLWLGVALVLDAIDGPLARAANVSAVWPNWSGDTLDLVVDYTTYVFVPAYAVAAGSLMPDALALPAAATIAITGTLYCANREMKTPDNFFRGFPAVWNLVVFYLLLLRPMPVMAAATIALFAVLTFVPMRFALALAAVKQGLAPAPWISAALCLIAVYFVLVGLLPARSDPK